MIKKNKILFIMLSLILIAIIILVYFFISNISRNEQKKQSQKEKYDCDLDIICNNHELKPGEVLMFDINVKNIQAKNGIILFETLIDYDKEVFEMEVTNDEQNNSWNKTSIIDNYLTMMRNDLMPTLENQLISKIKFKIKNTDFKGFKKIYFSKIKFTMENDEYFTKHDIEKEVKIIR